MRDREEDGDVAKGLPALIRDRNRQHNLEERPTPLQGLKIRREFLQPALIAVTLTPLAGILTERLHLPDRGPPVEFFAIDRG
jgi:hypothetical protein